MKRSKVLNLIKKLRHKHPDLSDEVWAEKILASLEKAGMPPFPYEFINNWGVKDWSYIFIGKVEWQPEGNKK